MSKTIKLWDGWKLTIDGEEKIFSSPPEVWEAFGWDVENDPNANECSRMITTEMYCFGHIDLTEMCGGEHQIKLEVIPATNKTTETEEKTTENTDKTTEENEEMEFKNYIEDQMRDNYLPTLLDNLYSDGKLTDFHNDLLEDDDEIDEIIETFLSRYNWYTEPAEKVMINVVMDWAEKHKQKWFKVTITQTVTKDIYVSAEDEYDAKEIIEGAIDCSEIDFDYDDAEYDYDVEEEVPGMYDDIYEQ